MSVLMTSKRLCVYDGPLYCMAFLCDNIEQGSHGQSRAMCYLVIKFITQRFSSNSIFNYNKVAFLFMIDSKIFIRHKF